MEIIDTEVLSVVPKIVKPVCEQRENESRRLWRDVTLSLRNNDIDKATAAKHANEERQRNEGKARAAEGGEWVPSVSCYFYFIKIFLVVTAVFLPRYWILDRH